MFDLSYTIKKAGFLEIFYHKKMARAMLNTSLKPQPRIKKKYDRKWVINILKFRFVTVYLGTQDKHSSKTWVLFGAI